MRLYLPPSDWVQDKVRSKFAFPGLCWEKSFIPEDVWKAGEGHSNLIESVHADVNREGIRCTLLGGLKKGQAFDKMKMKTLAVSIIFWSWLQLVQVRRHSKNIISVPHISLAILRRMLLRV